VSGTTDGPPGGQRRSSGAPRRSGSPGQRPGRPARASRGSAGHSGARRPQDKGRAAPSSAATRSAGTARARPASGVPELPPTVDTGTLDPDVRRQLRTLPKGLADEVAARLTAARDVLDEDPELAYRHASEAARIASRVSPTREALGITSYATGRWAQARSELRAARRLSGSDEYLPMIADCERGLHKPERALELAGSPEAARLDKAGKVEMRIVASGARRDLGQSEAAVLTLQCPELRDGDKPWSARLRYAFADALLEAGRPDEALVWFGRAVDSDPDGLTDAADRVDELTGTVFVDVEDQPAEP